MPAYASLRALLRSPPGLAVDGRPVYICVNPNIVAIVRHRYETNGDAEATPTSSMADTSPDM